MRDPRIHVVAALVMVLMVTAQGAIGEEARDVLDAPIMNLDQTARLEIDFERAALTALGTQDDLPDDPAPAGAGGFGEEGTWRFQVFGAYGTEFHRNNTQAGGGIGVSYFVADDFSVDLELLGLAFDQSGPDTYGGNLNLVFRWHFLAKPSWSIYADGGAGILKTSDDVPANGSNFNFTPMLGAGFSFAVGENWRTLLGARWYHLSNARTSDSNPGRDSIQFYFALSIPF